MRRASATWKRIAFFLVPCMFASVVLLGQQPGASTETPSRPFFVKQTWVVGGAGSWDYLTMDANAKLLYIAHGHSVQVVDVTTGAVTGEIRGLAEAHEVALDGTGEFGYISDELGARVVVFDRRTLATVATIDDVASPRAMAFEPQTGLLFAVRTDQAPAARGPVVPRTTTHITPRPAPAPAPPAKEGATSSITMIDTQSRKVVGQILLPGTLGFVIADGRGNIFVNVTDRNQIFKFNAQTAQNELPRAEGNFGGSDGAGASGTGSESAAVAPGARTAKAQKPATVDWTDRDRQFRSFSVAGQCTTPKSLAIDAAHTRLFAACDNMKLLVLNADNGDVVTTLQIGPGVDSVAYDAAHSLIYTANGGADGTLTVINQSVTDSYGVIQTLPTRQRARTLAVDSDTGRVYLVTDLLGVNLAQTGGAGAGGPGVETPPVNGSFQVLVVGN